MVGRLVTVPAFLLLIVSSLVPAATSQGASVLQDEGGTTVIAIRVPISEAMLSDGTFLEAPLESGLLEVDLQPVLLPGPGGTVDVDSFVADAVLAAGGGDIPLPSLIVIPEQGPMEGPEVDELEALGAELAALHAELDALAADLQLEADKAQGAAATELQLLQDEVAALAAEAAWLQMMTEELAAHAVGGIEEEIAVATALIARVQSGLELMEPVLAHVEEALADVVPEQPEPEPSPSEEPSPSPEPSPMETPFAKKIALLQEKADKAQRGLERAKADAEASRDELVAWAGAMATKVDGLVDEQGTIDGARIAAEAALAELQGDAEATVVMADESAKSALAQVEELRILAESTAAENQAALEASAAEAEAAIDEAIAPMKWSLEWTQSVQEWASQNGEASAADAAALLERSIGRAEGARAIVDRYVGEHLAPSQLAEAESQLEDAASDLEDAQASLEEAVASFGAELEGALAPSEEEEPPAEEPSSSDLEVCYVHEDASVCASYLRPLEADQEIIILVAVPSIEVDGLIPGDITSSTLPGSGLPSISVPSTQIPDLGGLPPLPSISLPGTQLPSVSPPSVSLSPILSPSDSSQPQPQPSETGSAPKHGFTLSASPKPLDMKEGEQGVLEVVVRNTGDAADTFRITLKNDAPVTADSSKESLRVEAGKEGRFELRITPLDSGSGDLVVVATGDNSGTQRHTVPVSVAQKVTAASSKIAAAVDPTQLSGRVGSETLVSVSLRNDGSSTDTIQISLSGKGLKVEPSSVSTVLQPGQSEVKQFRVTPKDEGETSLSVALRGTGGLDMKPVVLVSVAPALGDPGSGPDASGDEDDSDGKKGSSPGPAVPLIVAGVAMAVLFLRRRRAA